MTAPRLCWPLDEAAPSPLWRDAPGPKHLSPALLARWRRFLDEADAPPAARAALARLADPETAVVVTGQQPGIWGGPLYSLYKAATAVALAEARAAATGAPAVAVFWINGDDTDWDEVSWGAFPGDDLEVVRHRWTSPLGSRRWVGGAKVGAPGELAARLCAAGVPAALVGEPLGETPVELGGAFARTLFAYFGDRGLIPLDARWPELRAAGASLWRAYVDAHGPLAAAVTARGRELAPGGAPPLDAGAADHGLFLLEGDRRADIDPETWETEARRALDADRPDLLAPSVLLRAPLQDHLFGSVAHVVGRGEAAYLRQLGPVYAALGVAEPVRVPRLHATLAPGALVPREEIARAGRDPEGWLAERVRTELSGEALAALRRLEDEVEARLGEVVAAAAEPRADLEQLAASSARKIKGQLARVEEALDRRARRALYQESPALRHLAEFLRPRRAEQDRGLSGAALALGFAAAAPTAVLDAAAAHVQRLREGTVHHFVLEAPGG